MIEPEGMGPIQPADVPPTRPRRRWRPWQIGLIGCGALIGILFILALIGAIAGSGGIGDKVAIVRVTGTISSGRSPGGLFETGAGAETVGEQLREAARDASVRAILVRINSPGGSAAGSQETYAEIERARKKKKVVVSMGDVAASGGYYIASAADWIVADRATITASIGVLTGMLPLGGLLKKIGIEPQVVASGKHKAMGAFDPLTSEQRKLLQELITEMHEQFLGDVLKGRKRLRPKLDESRIREIADGRVLSGVQAKELGLIDELGNFHDALLAAGRLGGIKGEPRTTECRRRGFVERLFGMSQAVSPIQPVGDYLFYSRLAAALGGSSLQ